MNHLPASPEAAVPGSHAATPGRGVGGGRSPRTASFRRTPGTPSSPADVHRFSLPPLTPEDLKAPSILLVPSSPVPATPQGLGCGWTSGAGRAFFPSADLVEGPVPAWSQGSALPSSQSENPQAYGQVGRTRPRTAVHLSPTFDNQRCVQSLSSHLTSSPLNCLSVCLSVSIPTSVPRNHIPGRPRRGSWAQ